MDGETEKDRAKRRKIEQEQRELEYELSRDLKIESDKREMKKIEDTHRNKYEDIAIIFITTLALCYLLLYVCHSIFNMFFGQALAFLGISIGFIYPFFHAAIWIIAIISAYQRRSLLDHWLHRYF